MRLPFTRPPRFAPSAASRPARAAALFFSWRNLGAVLVAVMLARWVWLFAAPVEVSIPATTSWKKSDAAAELFGHAAEVNANTVAASSSYQLIGVFAHPTAGFAVVLVDGKQVGAGLGGEVSPGMRLVETAATYVLLERGGVKQRVELQAGNAAASGITRVASAAQSNSPALPAPTAFEANDELATIPPEQRDAIRQELENFRRRH